MNPTTLMTTNSAATPGPNQTPTLKLIIFKLKAEAEPNTALAPISLYLGVRIEQVAQIVRHGAVHGSGQTLAGVATVGEQQVTILDLRQTVFRVPSQQTNFLVILKGAAAELIGIPVAQSPALVDVPIADLRVLPDTYRQLDTLGMASHVCLVETEEEGRQTIFLLDLEKALALVTAR
uniref:CheW domain protein n=1 Tax=Cyanothece sp. (strain PCC 7425 / ATCC 29141) TaxID=395961 RepID=B8HNS0_CYAP4